MLLRRSVVQYSAVRYVGERSKVSRGDSLPIKLQLYLASQGRGELPRLLALTSTSGDFEYGRSERRNEGMIIV